MSINAGSLNRRIVIEEPAHTIDPGTGATIPGWRQFARVWAEEIPLSTRLRVSAPKVMPARTSTFRIRPLAGVNEAMRIVYSGATWRITGISPTRERDGLELFAEAIEP